MNDAHDTRLGTFLRKDLVTLTMIFLKAIRSQDGMETLFLFHFPSLQSELYLAHANVEDKKICLYQSDIVGRGTMGNFCNRHIFPAFSVRWIA